MKKPFKFKVNGLEYEVVETPTCEKVFEDKEGVCCLGLCEYREQRIYLLDSQTDSRMTLTLRHELTHAFIEATANQRETYTEEDVCEIVSRYGKQINDIVDSYFKARGNNGQR